MRFRDLFKVFERRSGLARPSQWLVDMFMGGSSVTGVTVNEKTALRATAVYASVRIIAETIASLPLPVYERQANGGKNRAIDHPLYRVLHDEANPEMTSFSFREMMMTGVLLWGNSFAEIQRNQKGEVIALWPIAPDLVTIQRNKATNNLEYIVQISTDEAVVKKAVILPSDRMLHIPGLSFNGVSGMSPIRLHKEAIGLSLAAEEYGARFFGNGAKPGGVLEHPSSLKEEAQKRLRSSWNEMHQGLDKTHRIAILEEGMQYKQIGIPPEEAQFLETRKFQVSEIARIFRVPPHMLADLERATFSNIEHQSIDYVVHTIRPWLVRWEQAMKLKLLVGPEKSRFFAEFLVDGLLRGDYKSRQEGLAIQRQNGVINADEWRGLENMNPQEGGTGNIYLVNGNMLPVDKAGNPPQMVTAPPESSGNEDE